MLSGGYIKFGSADKKHCYCDVILIYCSQPNAYDFLGREACMHESNTCNLLRSFDSISVLVYHPDCYLSGERPVQTYTFLAP